MKEKIIAALHRVFGYERYLFIFAIYKVFTKSVLKDDPNFLAFLTLISQDHNVLDIGANIGVMTTLFSKKIESGNIYAFEPIPSNAKTVKRIINFFGIKNAKLYEFALGDAEGKATMVLPTFEGTKKHGLSFINNDKNHISKRQKGIEYTVDQHKLDNLKELREIKIDAIKIDVENYEYFVFKGGEELIRHNKPLIFCELWEGENRDRVFNMLKPLGYKVQCVVNRTIVDFDPLTHDKQDFIFVPA